MAVLPDGVRGCVLDPSRTQAYFFAGDRYWRYDLKRDYGEVRYPAALSLWNLPAAFAGGVDAAVDLKGSEAPRAYFFKDDQYVRYDWNSNAVDEGPASIGAFWQLGIEGFAGGVDAAVNGEGPYDGKTYFFKGDRYVRFDWATEAIDGGPTPIGAWNLGPGFESDIAACCTAVRSGRPKTYFFKAGRYVRYDWGHDRADPGYPLSVSAGWPSGLAVWAEHTRAPLRSCADARLEAGESWRIAYPQGTPKGQAGWQLGVTFTDPGDLADVLEGAKIPAFYGDDDAGTGTIAPGSVTRLGIVAQGTPGSLDTGAGRSDLANRLSASAVAAQPLRAQLKRIGQMLAPGAPIVLLGGDVAGGSAGDDLLAALSGVWPDHPVSGFTRTGDANNGRQRRPGEPCDNPGLRVTEGDWAHESLPHHRKTALDGQVDVHA